MELSDDAPKFPKLPFLLADAGLIGVAIYVAIVSGTPLPEAAIYTITGCVALAAMLGALPYLLDYNRRQDVQLTDRQHALEALARTTAAAVEQASIAASGLHQIVELAQKNLRIADQLPQKLHERINEFSRAQDDALTAELESLQQEVNTLRASEAEKLETAADKIHRAATELTKFEASFRQQAQALDTAAQRAEKTIAAAAATAVARIEQTLSAARALPTAAAEPNASPRPAKAPTSGSHDTHSRAPIPRVTATAAVVSPETAAPKVAPHAEPLPADQVSPAASPPATPSHHAPAAVAAPAPARKAAAKRRSTDDEAVLPGVLEEAAPSPSETKTDAKHGSRSHAAAVETAPAPPAEAAPEPAPSSDGVTRLIVTAYIGIGNRLFLRGEGPGLSWDRGVPLQFVSIGKWRWETTDAHHPVSIKLYKNDEIECAAVGQLRLKPGHQREVTATF